MLIIDNKDSLSIYITFFIVYLIVTLCEFILYWSSSGFCLCCYFKMKKTYAGGMFLKAYNVESKVPGQS